MNTIKSDDIPKRNKWTTIDILLTWYKHFSDGIANSMSHVYVSCLQFRKIDKIWLAVQIDVRIIEKQQRKLKQSIHNRHTTQLTKQFNKRTF